MDYSHFNEAVPTNVRKALFNCANLVKDEHIAFNHNSYGDEAIEPIWGQSLDGYIPFQQGGYCVSSFHGVSIDTDTHLSTAHSKWLDEQQIELDKAFLDTFPHANLNNLTLEQQNEYAEFEAEYYTPVLVSFNIFVSMDTKVWLQFKIGFLDAPYYREHAQEQIHTDSYLADDFAQNWQEYIKDFFTTVMNKLKHK
jgi:hypothetical protein